MRKLTHKAMIVTAATIALASFSIATDALARGGGGGGGHGGGGGMHGGGGGGMHFGGGGGGMHLGGGGMGGMHLGGNGGMHLGGPHFGSAPIGTGRSRGARLGGTSHQHHHAMGRGRRHFAHGVNDFYDSCWQPYRVRLGSAWRWHRRWICD